MVLVELLPMEARLERLLAVVRGADSVLIVTHNDPDPDAIGSALALRYLLAERADVEGEIAYRGIIGRAENKALVDYLGQPLALLRRADLEPRRLIALIDTQPGAGNNALPAAYADAVRVIFDHHPLRDEAAAVAFADIRSDVGATSTMLTQYLRAAELEPPPPIATALFYGIKTDTMGLVRDAGQDDVEAYFYLQSRIDFEALAEIEHAQVPADYFAQLVTGLQAARLYDGVVISYVGPMERPDLAAEIADLLSRLEDNRWVVCLGTYDDALVLSVRTWSEHGGAGQLAQAIVGELGSAGGHGMMAGGYIRLRGRRPDVLVRRIVERALDHLDLDSGWEGEPLIASR
jgi:nanoRNase/pAp phosphatase (c-di-AMP/oligoRNAs hydrolase)